MSRSLHSAFHRLCFVFQSKDVVETLPSVLKENMPKEDALALAAKFKEIGAVCVLV